MWYTNLNYFGGVSIKDVCCAIIALRKNSSSKEIMD